MRVWRLCQRWWSASAFSGLGAAEYPGRWNSSGHKAVYCADSLALAAMEILANAGNQRLLSRTRWVAFPVEIPEPLIARPPRLPADWRTKPPAHSTRRLGDRLLGDPRFPVLQVPSAIISSEFCYILRPDHPRFSEIQIGAPQPFEFDRRVLHG